MFLNTFSFFATDFEIKTYKKLTFKKIFKQIVKKNFGKIPKWAAPNLEQTELPKPMFI